MTTIDTHSITPDKMMDAMKRASAGEDVFVTNEGKRVFKITEVEPVGEGLMSKKRRAGTMKGKIWLADDWDADSVNEEIAQTFYESEIFPKNN